MPDSSADPWATRPWRLLPNRVSRFYRGGLLIDRFRGEPEPADTDRPEDWIEQTAARRLQLFAGDIRRLEADVLEPAPLVTATRDTRDAGAFVGGPAWIDEAGGRPLELTCASSLPQRPSSPLSLSPPARSRWSPGTRSTTSPARRNAPARC